MALSRLSTKRLLLVDFILVFLTVASGQDNAKDKICEPANFDVQNLTSKIWRFDVPSMSCLNATRNLSPTDGCKITMAFCRPVNRTGHCRNSSVCESLTSVNHTYNLGTYVPRSDPFNTSALPSGLGFTVRYQHGEKYVLSNKTTCTLQTVMTFFCNATALWRNDTSADVLDVPFKPTIVFTPKMNVCTYNLTFDFAGACPVTTPSRFHRLSAGSVLIMLLIVLVIFYFVFGCFINIARGKAGEEVIPHHRFWAMLPVYIMRHNKLN
ncbi:hypothetical protein ACOMHN_047952 [Nucella lapillus]